MIFFHRRNVGAAFLLDEAVVTQDRVAKFFFNRNATYRIMDGKTEILKGYF